MSVAFLTQDQKSHLMDEDREKCNEQQLWRTPGRLKVCYMWLFNCIFGCKIPGPKNSEELLQICHACHELRIPNVLWKFRVSRDFPVDEVNFFSSKESAQSGFSVYQEMMKQGGYDL